ncbi:MAG TPA: phosphatase PAP2 family protein [bacterium]|nr:phosphatase PAP2 family protein [bacterium]
MTRHRGTKKILIAGFFPVFMLLLPVLSQAENNGFIEDLFFRDFCDVGTAVAADPLKSIIIGGGTAALTAAVFLNDGQIRRTFESNRNIVNDYLFEAANMGGEGLFVLAANSFFFLGGEKERMTGRLVIESMLVSGAITYAAKMAGGRLRPWDTGNPREFKSFSGNQSMPSGHASTAFSWAVVIGDRYDIGYITYPLAFMTGLARIYKNAHWASDVVSGAFVGIITAKAIINSDRGRDFKMSALLTERGTPLIGVSAGL